MCPEATWVCWAAWPQHVVTCYSEVHRRSSFPLTMP